MPLDFAAVGLGISPTTKCPSAVSIRKEIEAMGRAGFLALIKRLGLHRPGRLFSKIPVYRSGSARMIDYLPFEQAHRESLVVVHWPAVSNYLHGFLCGGMEISPRSHSWADFVGGHMRRGARGEVDFLVWGDGRETPLHTA